MSLPRLVIHPPHAAAPPGHPPASCSCPAWPSPPLMQLPRLTIHPPHAAAHPGCPSVCSFFPSTCLSCPAWPLRAIAYTPPRLCLPGTLHPGQAPSLASVHTLVHTCAVTRRLQHQGHPPGGSCAVGVLAPRGRAGEGQRQVWGVGRCGLRQAWGTRSCAVGVLAPHGRAGEGQRQVWGWDMGRCGMWDVDAAVQWQQ
eukprot:364071-Chlamydomonas_euryale.AAC.9